MKKLLLLFALALMLFSCGHHNTAYDYAKVSADTISRNVFPNLRNFEPISLELDTVYQSAFFDKDVLLELAQIDYYDGICEEHMELDSIFSNASKQVEQLQLSIYNKANNVDREKMFGWKVTYRFSATDDLGLKNDYQLIFFMDLACAPFTYVYTSPEELEDKQQQFLNAIEAVKERERRARFEAECSKYGL